MPTKTKLVREELGKLAGDVRNLAVVIREDPKKRRRKEWAWRGLYAALSAVFTIAARRFAMRLWWVLTGRSAPVKQR
jgi:hypothetical protein